MSKNRSWPRLAARLHADAPFKRAPLIVIVIEMSPLFGAVVIRRAYARRVGRKPTNKDGD